MWAIAGADDFLQAWYVAYISGNATAVADLFTVDARLGPYKGRTSIATSLKKAFTATSYDCRGHFEELHELDTLAVAWGIETCVETSKSGELPSTSRERWLIVFERQVNGKWLISRETWQDL